MHATLTPTPFLRAALLADAAAGTAMGLGLAVAAGPLSGLFGLPAPLLLAAGLLLLPWSAFVAWVGTRPAIARRLVRAIVLVNLLWVADSLLLVALGPVLAGLAPTASGVGFVVAQALAVLGVSVAQAAAMRQAPAGVEAAA